MGEFDEIRSFSVSVPEAGARLDVYLASVSGFSRSKVKSLIDDGLVTVNDSPSCKPSRLVAAGDEIEVLIPPVSEPGFFPENIPLDIVYEDDRLLVVNKPAGMVVHPGCGNITGTLAAGLLHHCRSISRRGGATRPGIVHRLDMDTSGLLVVALDDDMHAALSGLLAERSIKRTYTAFVWGHPEPGSGTVDAPIGRHPRVRTLQTVVSDGRPSVTHYDLAARYRFLSRLSVNLQTGRTHQIRVHLAHIGHHVFGDPDYGGREERLKGFSPEIRDEARRLLRILNRQALHAGRLEFRHPATGHLMVFEAALPEDMARLQTELEREE